jgi:hypothetical protein
VFAEEADCFEEDGFDLGPLSLADPGEEFVAIGGREFTYFPGFSFEKVGHGDSSTELGGKDIGSLLSWVHDSEDVYICQDVTAEGVWYHKYK